MDNQVDRAACAQAVLFVAALAWVGDRGCAWPFVMVQTWIWMTALVYLVARTKWRLDRWRLRREQEQEAAIQAQQDEEWQR